MIPSLLYLIAVIGSMMSQLPFLIGTTTGSLLKYAWFLPLAYLGLVRPRDFFNSRFVPFMLLFGLFALYCFVMTGMSGVSYMGADLYNIMLSFVIALISYVFWKNFASEKFLTILSIVLLACAVILAYVVYNTSFIEYDILSRQYAYASKNSMAQILFAALLVSNVVLLQKSNFIKVVTLAISVLVFWVILVLKSRATLLSVLYVVAYFSLSYKNKYVRRAVFLVCVALAAVLIINPEIWNTVYNGFILAGRDANDLDDLSSGRLPLMKMCWNLFLEKPIFGVGNLYMDCFPLVMLTQYGIVGASIVFGIVLYAYKRVKKPSNNVVHLSAYLLLLSFLINSLFEAQPPFGPGAKCFFIWMMFGFLMGNKANGSRIDICRC